MVDMGGERVKLGFCSNSIFGPFKSGYIRARGMLLPGTLQPNNAQILFQRSGSVLGYLCNAVNPWMDRATRTDQIVFCVLTRFSVARGAEGLVLAKTGSKLDEYRRIGVFNVTRSVYGDGRPSRFLRYALEQRRWTLHSITTFTIV